MKKVCDSNSSGHISNTGASRTNKLLMAGLFSALTRSMLMDKYKSVFYSGPCKYGADGPISGRAHAGMQIRFL